MEHPYGPLSLLPPVVAIVMAILTRRIILSLLVGLFVGALIMNGWTHPFAAIADLLEVHIWKTVVQEDKLRVCAFTLLMGAMIGVISRSGGMRGLVAAVSPWANTPRRGQLVTWFLGLLIFFDDYANTMLLGNTLRPLCDRLRISREKLAYLVDSTAAPVAGLAVISTWVASEIMYIQEGLAGLPNSQPGVLNATQLFLDSIPYRFYVLFALVFVPLVASMRRDFGPMLAAERRAARGDAPPWRVMADLSSGDPAGVEASSESGSRKSSHWLNAVVPIVVTVGVVFWLLYVTGETKFRADNPKIASPTLQQIVGASDSYLALVYGSLSGMASAAALVWLQGLLNSGQIVSAAGAGSRTVLPALAILMLASVMSTMTRSPNPKNESIEYTKTKSPKLKKESTDPFEQRETRLYTGAYLSRIITGQGATSEDSTATAAGRLWLLPTIVFVLSSVVAFATGTSWGTMGIIMPMVIPLFGALSLAAGPVEAGDPVLLGTIGGVLAGAIFGDHCSPISDTTVLSSQSSGCDHVAHVWTQLPYALAVGGVSILCGTLPIGLGAPVWALLPLGVAAMVVVLLVFGRRPNEEDAPSPTAQGQ